MHASVKNAWIPFTDALEGFLVSMYVDILNLVTTGRGNLIDPVAGALQLPWKHANAGMAMATSQEVAAAFYALKRHPGLAVKPGGPLVPLPRLGASVAARLNDLRLTKQDVDDLTFRKLDENVSYLRRTFHNWEALPADAQLGILSMAWAVGPGFTQKFGNFTRCALAGQWAATIAKDARGGYAAKIREENNAGIVPRNAKNRLCFANAGLVLDGGLDVTVLHWPEVVAASAFKDPAALPTVPSVQQALDARAAAQAALSTWTNSEAAKLRDIGSGSALSEYEAAGLKDDPEPVA